MNKTKLVEAILRGITEATEIRNDRTADPVTTGDRVVEALLFIGLAMLVDFNAPITLSEVRERGLNHSVMPPLAEALCRALEAGADDDEKMLDLLTKLFADGGAWRPPA